MFSHSAISVCTENHGLPTRELLETANSVRLRLAGSSSVTAVYTLSSAHQKRQIQFSSYSRWGVGGGQVSVLYVILLLFKADVTIYFPFLLWFDLASVDSPVHMVPDGYDRNYFPQLL